MSSTQQCEAPARQSSCPTHACSLPRPALEPFDAHVSHTTCDRKMRKQGLRQHGRREPHCRHVFQAGTAKKQPVSPFVVASSIPTPPTPDSTSIGRNVRSRDVDAKMCPAPPVTRKRDDHCLAVLSPAPPWGRSYLGHTPPLRRFTHDGMSALITPGRPRRAPVTTPAAAVVPMLVLTFVQPFTSLVGVTPRGRCRMSASPEAA